MAHRPQRSTGGWRFGDKFSQFKTMSEAAVEQLQTFKATREEVLADRRYSDEGKNGLLAEGVAAFDAADQNWKGIAAGRRKEIDGELKALMGLKREDRPPTVQDLLDVMLRQELRGLYQRASGKEQIAIRDRIKRGEWDNMARALAELPEIDPDVLMRHKEFREILQDRATPENNREAVDERKEELAAIAAAEEVFAEARQEVRSIAEDLPAVHKLHSRDALEREGLKRVEGKQEFEPIGEAANA